MTTGPDEKNLRSLRDNPAGKVVTDRKGTRWEWDAANGDDTAHLLEKLENSELAIERTDIRRAPRESRGTVPKGSARLETTSSGHGSAAAPPRPGADRGSAGARQLPKRTARPSDYGSGRDSSGGFNPYDNPGKPPRR